MPTLFEQFDFKLLDDADFREDSVREELIVPLLTALGYSASPPYKIIRSKKLEHPFVYFGTIRKGINIIPDYLMERDGKYQWILDAKSPMENIDTGKNVEQAYSYAMHKEIRVPIYALCNGRKLVVFHVHHEKPLFDVLLKDIQFVWAQLLALLGSRAAWQDGRRPEFASDLGLALTKAGFADAESGKRIVHVFLTVPIMTVGVVKTGLYTISSPCSDVAILDDPDGTRYMMSFDFGEKEYQEFLTKIDSASAEQIRDALSQQPFTIGFKSSVCSPHVGIAARLGDDVYTNEDESYRPFIAVNFI